MAARRRSAGCPSSCRSWPRWSSPGVKNLNYGDADSVGFFQMRVGIWNKGAYAGFPDKPELQVKWFLDQAEAVKKQRIAAGKSVDRPATSTATGSPTSSGPPSSTAAATSCASTRPTALLAQGRPRRAAPRRVDQAAAAAAPAASRPRPPTRPPPCTRRRRRAGPQALAALTRPRSTWARQYQWGGSTPQTGFDCSGLDAVGLREGRHPDPARDRRADRREQRRSPVDRGDLRPATSSSSATPGNVHHVGMSLGGDKFMHAPHTGDVVKVSEPQRVLLREQFAGGRRFDHQRRRWPTPRSAAPRRRRAAPARPPRRPSTRTRSPRRRPPSRATPPRSAATTPACSWRSRTQEERKPRARVAMFLKAIEPERRRPAAAGRRGRRRGRRARRRRPGRRAAPAPPAAVQPAAAPPSADAAAAADAGTPIHARRRTPADYPGNNASTGRARQVARQAGREARPPARAAGDGVARRVRRQEPQLRRRRLGRLLPDARRDLEQGRLRRLPGEPRAAGQVVHRPGARRQEARRSPSGDANFGKDPSKWGEWIADVERPAEQYRGRYQLRLGEARGLLKG